MLDSVRRCSLLAYYENY